MNKPTFLAASLLAAASLAACGESAETTAQQPVTATVADAPPTETAMVDAAAVPASAAAQATPAPAAEAPAPVAAEKAAPAAPKAAEKPAAAEKAPTAAAPAPAATDPSCPPEHAAMGHCTPKAPAADPHAGHDAAKSQD